jgi:hypothetical protein
LTHSKRTSWRIQPCWVGASAFCDALRHTPRSANSAISALITAHATVIPPNERTHSRVESIIGSPAPKLSAAQNSNCFIIRA